MAKCVHLPKTYDVVDAMMRYEAGELDHDETLRLFTHLIRTGMAWQLQGAYGRVANELIELGYVKG